MAKAETDATPPIRLASTVVVMRGASPEIFMVRRSAKSPFMPDTFVFPGGRLDPEDGDPTDPANADAVFERAARRETLEEASIDLAARRLAWFDTWLTPSAEGRRRYLARFYIARLDASEAQDARPDGFETTDGFWSSPRGVLERWEAGDVDLPPPTLSVLLNLAAPAWASVFDRDRGELDTPILPKVVPSGQALHIVMPHDPQYAELPGEARPAPPRVLDLPQRFVRDGNRWRPHS